ncbi:MAG: energy transducer TonB [bacterium]|nr:energy transducer TonB [bacterium]
MKQFLENYGLGISLGLSLFIHGGAVGLSSFNFFEIQDITKKEDIELEIQFESPPLLPKLEQVSEQTQFVPLEKPIELPEPTPVDTEELSAIPVESEEIPIQDTDNIPKEESAEPVLENTTTADLPKQDANEAPMEPAEEEPILPVEETAEPLIKEQENPAVPSIKQEKQETPDDRSTQKAQVSDIHSEMVMRYEDTVKQYIQSAQKYPSSARRMRLQGVVKLEFALLPSGALHFVRVKEPCPYKILNESAQQSVKKASPFPAFPSDIDSKTLTMTVDIVYKLN